MNIIIFEDNKTKFLNPFALNHASFELRCGAFTNIERYEFLNNVDKIILIVRDELTPIIKERYPSYIINPDIIPAGICINGTFVVSEEKLKILNNLENSSYEGKLISFILSSEQKISEFNKIMKEATLVTKEVNVNNINYLWDAIRFSSTYLKQDFNFFEKQNNFSLDSSSLINNLENIYFGENANVKAGTILDASKGPIIIDDGVIIGNGAIIEGPAYIGKNTIISSRATIRGNTSIGPMCKVGGEISSSIFHAFSNKVHDGFLGNSYIGEWVNIGAGTNNSNLKNNYSNIKFDFGDGKFDTGEQFLGTMIGDYCRIGISTMINTGTYIGLGSNVYGGDFQKNFINSFMWDENEKVDLEKLLITIRKMKERRHQELSKNEINLINNIYY